MEPLGRAQRHHVWAVSQSLKCAVTFSRFPARQDLQICERPGTSIVAARSRLRKMAMPEGAPRILGGH